MIYHNPVLLKESVDGLVVDTNGIYVDVTFGGGGHSKEILKRLDHGKLIAFDQDTDALANKLDDDRFILVNDNFRSLSRRLDECKAIPVDGLLADLGVSSHQFDEPSRGFSIRFDSDLDMRMNQDSELTAKHILNYYEEEDLIRLFKEYGELHNAWKIAKAIVKARSQKEITSSDEFKSIIKACALRGKENSFYAQVYQALRIEVNDEMKALSELLLQVPEILKKGGRMVVISYHSLEDRMVKNLINTGNIQGILDKDIYGNVLGLKFKSMHKKTIEPSDEEVEQNSRARSAKMRIAERI
jgi:16S rRNA (cytosine1402-N4)-methyltransferase